LFIEFSQHLRCEIDIHRLEGIHHLSAAKKDILTLIRMPAVTSALMGFFCLRIFFIPCYFFVPGFPECRHISSFNYSLFVYSLCKYRHE